MGNDSILSNISHLLNISILYKNKQKKTELIISDWTYFFLFWKFHFHSSILDIRVIKSSLFLKTQLLRTFLWKVYSSKTARYLNFYCMSRNYGNYHFKKTQTPANQSTKGIAEKLWKTFVSILTICSTWNNIFSFP